MGGISIFHRQVRRRKVFLCTSSIFHPCSCVPFTFVSWAKVYCYSLSLQTLVTQSFKGNNKILLINCTPCCLCHVFAPPKYFNIDISYLFVTLNVKGQWLEESQEDGRCAVVVSGAYGGMGSFSCVSSVCRLDQSSCVSLLVSDGPDLLSWNWVSWSQVILQVHCIHVTVIIQKLNIQIS